MNTETKSTLDLKSYQFKQATSLDIAFPTFNTDPVLLKEAEARGFNSHHNPYCKLFSTLFYSGGKVKFKEGIDEAFRKNAWMYMRALMGSFAPKHEHKEAVCAMILSELCEPELDKS